MLTFEEVNALEESQLRTLFAFCMKSLRERDLNSNPICSKLAAMTVGESILFENRFTYLTTAPSYTRHHYNMPHAQWKTKLTTKGLRVTRVA